MARTTPHKVRATLNADYSVDYSTFMRTANTLTDYVVAQDSAGLLDDDLALEIETYLAAHFCALHYQQLEDETAGDAKVTFQTSVKGKGLEATDWGQQAMVLDVTGTLTALNDRKQTAAIYWLGTPLSQQSGKTRRDGGYSLYT